MPRSIYDHGAEIVNNKIYIFGGNRLQDQYDFYPIDNVLMFDPATNNFTELQPLPYAVSEIATVSCKNNVVILGGIGSIRCILHIKQENLLRLL